MKKTIASALAILALSGCSRAVDGTVIGKTYDAPHTYMEQQCMMYNQNMTCKVYTWVPVHYPAEWKLRVNDRLSGKKKTVEVDQLTYNNTPIGASFSNGDV